MDKKTILFCGNALSTEIFEVLHKKYTILMISDFADDVGKKYTKEWIVANSKNPNEALNAAIFLSEKGYNFEAVLSLGWDSAISVSLIGEHFNLNVIPLFVAQNSTNKILRSRIFQKCNVPSPLFEVCKNLEDIKKAASIITYPIVLKPINLSAARGTILVENEAELNEAYNYSLGFLSESENYIEDNRNEYLIVNQFIRGTEYSTEGLMINSKFYPTGISERVFRYKESKPYFVEIGDVLPVKISKELQQRCFKITEEAALALSITDGIVKGDLVITPDEKVLVFEITPRLGGPRFGTEIIPLSNGTNILEAALQQALYEEVDIKLLEPSSEKGVVTRYIFPETGRITNIEGLDKIKELPGYYDFKWLNYLPYKINDIVEAPEKLCAGVGYFIATGKDRDEAIYNADVIENTIKITTE